MQNESLSLEPKLQMFLFQKLSMCSRSRILGINRAQAAENSWCGWRYFRCQNQDAFTRWKKWCETQSNSALFRVRNLLGFGTNASAMIWHTSWRRVSCDFTRLRMADGNWMPTNNAASGDPQQSTSSKACNAGVCNGRLWSMSMFGTKIFSVSSWTGIFWEMSACGTADHKLSD